jgi:AcrR family transcriptional regulator
MMDPEIETGYPRKRAQTRARLRRAGMSVIAVKGTSATVGEIAGSAGVAQGTFYNHFPSLDGLVAEIAEELGSGVEIAQDALDAVERDPAARVALGVLQLLGMADGDETAAAAFVTLAAIRADFRGRVRAIVGRAIVDGAETGRFTVEPGPAATNAVLGATLQSMRSIILGETETDIAPDVARLVLRVLGVADAEADRVVDRAREIVRIPPVAALPGPPA